MDRAEVVDSWLDAVPRGPRALVVEGEPGLGKSTVFRSILTGAEARSYTLLSAQPSEAEADLAMVVLRDLVDGVARDDAGEPAAAVRAILDGRVRARDRLALLSYSTLELVRVAASKRPVLIAIDDVEWVDPASRRVLSYVVRRLRDEAVGTIVTRSDGSLPLPLGLRDAAPDLVDVITLPPWTAGQLARLVEGRTGAPIGRVEAERLCAVTGGNPFLALEIVAAIGRGERGATGLGIPIPRGVRDDVVRSRIDSLPPRCRELLFYASVLSRPTMESLALWSAEPGAGLQPGIDAGVVSVEDGSVRFTHPIYRSVVYSLASRARRHDAHARAAELVPDPLERLRHLALAADTPQEDLARQLEDGAREARGVGDLATSADLMSHSVRLTPSASDARPRRLVEQAMDLFGAGETSRALDLLEEARGGESLEAVTECAVLGAEMALAAGRVEEAGRRAGDAMPAAEALPGLASRARVTVAEAALRLGNLAAATAAARELVDAEGVAAERAAAVLIRVEILAGEPQGSSRTDAWRIRLADAERAMVQGDHVRALTAARALGATSPDGDGLVSAQTLRAEAAYRLGELAEATEAAAAALAEAESLGRGTSGPLCASSRIDAMRGEHAGAERLADRAADAAGDDRLALLSALTCSAVAVSWGRGADAAWEVVGKAIASFEEIGIGEPAAYLFLPEVVTIAIEVGDVEVAERWQRWLEERGAALGRPYAIAAGSHAAGKLAASRGDLDTAIDAFESATMALARLQMPFELARSMLEQGSALRRRGAKRPARALLDEAEELFSTVGAGAWARRCAEERIRIGGRRAQTVLTEAEFRVARLAAGGRTNREIAATLFVSERTVESHLSHIYAKLDVRSRTELAVVFSASES